MVKPLDSYVCKIDTLREMGLSYKGFKEKLGLKSRSTAQTAYQRFLRTNSYVAKKHPVHAGGEKTPRPVRKAQRKRAKTNSSKSGKIPKNNIRTSKSTAKLFFNVTDSF